MDAMIISPDLEARMRLKQAMAFVPEFKVVKVMATLTEGLQRLFSGEMFGSFFVSALFGHDVGCDFIRKSKQTEGGRDAAYIFTLSGEAHSADIANDLVQGADGFLVEPFSVEALQKIYQLAVEVRKQRIQVRQRASLRLLLQTAMDGIDEWAWNSSLEGVPPVSTPSRLGKVRDSILALPEDQIETYFEVLEEVFCEIQKPRILGYRGASRRLRKKYGMFSGEKTGPFWRIMRK